MPLLTFDLIEGRTEQEIRTLLDAAHRAVLRAFEVRGTRPLSDCSRKQSPPYGD